MHGIVIEQQDSDGGSVVWGILSEFSDAKISDIHRVQLWSVYLRLGGVFRGFIINTSNITFRGSTKIELTEVVFYLTINWQNISRLRVFPDRFSYR